MQDEDVWNDFVLLGCAAKNLLLLLLNLRSTPTLWLVTQRMGKNPALLEFLHRAHSVVGTQRLVPRLDRGKGAHDSEVAVHQALLYDVIHCLKQQDVLIRRLFAEERWRLVSRLVDMLILI